MFFLSYVSEMMHLLWNLTFFKMVPPKTNFFFSQTLGSTNQYSCQQFYGWGMTHLMPSYLKNAYVGEGPGETPSALSYPSYLINSFLTDIKQLAKTGKGDTVSAPFWCLCQTLCLFLLHLNKTLLHKLSEWSSLATGTRLNSSSPEAKNPSVFHSSATTFQ